MNLIEVQHPPLIGELNTNVLYQDTSGMLLLRRNPYENLRIMRSIEYEYREIGFIEKGEKIRRRSLDEQAYFAKHAFACGLRVLPPWLIQDKDVYYQFLHDAQTLDEFLPHASRDEAQHITLQLFDDLQRAHAMNVIYGDRWSRNMLVVPRKGLTHVDLDLDISGRRFAKEFEVAQAAYYTLSGGKEKVIGILSAILGSPKVWFHPEKVDRFLRGHARHFLETKYGHIEDETNVLIGLANRKRLE